MNASTPIAFVRDRNQRLKTGVKLGLVLVSLGLGAIISATNAYAHHSSQAEYGRFGSPTVYVEGVILEIHWSNPHVVFDTVVMGGEIEPDGHWRLESHSVDGMTGYGFARDDFAVGDTVTIIGWKSLRGTQTILLRAIQINEGPMRSSLRYRDMVDIANGTFDELGVAPAQNLHGAPPERAGADTVYKLHEMGHAR